jgi:deoxyadenosine/deoxycytidine kinase
MLIFLEANIGGGKSSFATKLIEKNLANITVLLEPLDEWVETSDSNDVNILQHYYSDPQKHSYLFQMNSFISRCKRLEEAMQHDVQKSKDTHIIMERSVFSDYYCFAKNCYELGTMTEIEFIVYKKWFEWLIEKFKIQPDGFIYMRTTPEECHNRIKKRSRKSEDVIPLEYLKSLHMRHDDWLLDSELKEKKNVLVLDGNPNFLTNDKLYDDYVEQIKKFIESL